MELSLQDIFYNVQAMLPLLQNASPFIQSILILFSLFDFIQVKNKFDDC